MKEMNACKVCGEVMAMGDSGLVVRSIGLDTKNEPWKDDHQIIAGSSMLKDLQSGDFVEVIGSIIDADRNQFIQAGAIAKKPASEFKVDTKAGLVTGYLNVAKLTGVVERETQYFPRTVNSDGKIQQQFANVTLKVLGTRLFGTLFGNLAADWKRNAPIGSEVILYGRMRRKEITNLAGDTRRWIDVASDDFNFPGLSKILKKGAGAKDEFAGLDEKLIAFTRTEPKKSLE